MAVDFILRISLPAGDAAAEELVQSAIFLSGSSGSTSFEESGRVVIEAYFEDGESRRAALNLLENVAGAELTTVERPRLDWLDRYQQSLHAIDVGRRFRIAPDRNLLPADDGRLSIVIPQERAFGTGSHETTALCLEMLEALDLDGMTALDIGSGSGILGIAMQMLGARKVFAFDNDPEAMTALCDNRERNGVAESSMPIFIGGMEALGDFRFDLVTMNILPEVILPLLALLSSHLSRSARVILSGVLIGRRDELVLAASAQRLDVIAERTKGEWWCGLLENRG
jgi:ribosomal protein L11 methyltransferase